jgi:hypothetical protein
LYVRKPIDRSGWPSGQWDNEPDEVKWITSNSSPVRAYRLRLNGAWACAVTSPCPTNPCEFTEFMKKLKILQSEPCVGMVSKTDDQGICNFHISFEHYDAPLNSTQTFGKYVTLDQVKVHCENLALFLSSLKS